MTTTPATSDSSGTSGASATPATPATGAGDRATAGPARRGSVRQRLLASADELFYAEGVHSVGIDRVIEHAGVAKASLYNSFRSKEELVHAYLSGRHLATRERLEAAVEEHTDPRDRVLAVFDAQGRRFSRPGFRGCAFAAASAESRPGGLVEEATTAYRTWFHDLFAGLARDLGARDPELLARQLQLIYDGAAAAGNLDHDDEAARTARAAVAALLDAAT